MARQGLPFHYHQQQKANQRHNASGDGVGAMAERGDQCKIHWMTERFTYVE